MILGIEKKVAEITHDQDLARQDRQLAKLAYADGAGFNSHHQETKPKCVRNTRVDLLHKLQAWSMNPAESIFWLNGMAGMGKSTIARTIANQFSEKGNLGASFFFSRDTSDLRHAQKFVTTVAYQLARSSPLIRKHICDAIALNDITTFQGNLRAQWKELILGPLTKLTLRNSSGLTLVVDALDECNDENHIKTILQLFVEADNLTTVNFKVLVTSRPETPIRIGFENMPQIIYHDLALHNIPRSIVENDISVYLEYELSETRRERKLAPQWPGEDRFKLLVQKTDCLFIYIATACHFIRDQQWHPNEQLSIVLQDDLTEDDMGDLPTAKLDRMYTQVLKQSVFNNRPGKQSRLSKRFEEIVGSIVILFDVLPAQGLAALLSKSNDDIDATLGSLHSVLNIPKNALDPIRLLHPSFRDFLLDMQRCRDIDIKIDEEKLNENLTRSCLRLISRELRRDICGLKMFGTQARDVSRAEIDSHLSKPVQYACCYWIDHLERINHHRPVKDDLLEDGGLIHMFFREHFLHWLEVLSLIGKMSEGVIMVTKLEAFLKVS